MTVPKGRTRKAQAEKQRATEPAPLRRSQDSKAKSAVTGAARRIRVYSSTFARVAEHASKLTLGTLTMLAVGLLLVTLFISLKESPMIIDPITVPRVMIDMGYTELGATRQLHDAIQRYVGSRLEAGVSVASMSTSTRKKDLKFMPRTDQIDIAAPGTGVSLSTLAQIIRRIWGSEQDRIGGEFLCSDDPCRKSDLSLRVRITHRGNPYHIHSIEKFPANL
jgi:hypothetical protein